MKYNLDTNKTNFREYVIIITFTVMYVFYRMSHYPLPISCYNLFLYELGESITTRWCPTVGCTADRGFLAKRRFTREISAAERLFLLNDFLQGKLAHHRRVIWLISESTFTKEHRRCFTLLTSTELIRFLREIHFHHQYSSF